MQETAEKLVDYFFAGTEDADRLNRFYLPFRKEDEDLPESAEEEEDEEDPQPEEQTEKGGPMSVDPEFHILTNVDLVCRDCIYRIPEMGVGTCHKYLMKTGEVLNGEACPKHRKEKEG